MICAFCGKNAEGMMHSVTIAVPTCDRCLTIFTTAMAAGELFNNIGGIVMDQAIMRLVDKGIIPADAVRRRGDSE